MMTRIEERLGHHFQDKQLLEEALSHPSLSSEIRPAPADNQRLEFLGDAVLELAITDFLYHHYPKLREGLLTKLRASVVSKPALAEVARRLDVGKALKMSNGEEGSGGRERASNLADAVESLFGAVYLDAGQKVASEVILKNLKPELDAMDPETTLGNSKGELQEILQQLDSAAPAYQVENEEGPPHDRTYFSTVIWKKMRLGSGAGSSKKTSEAAAAQDALEKRLWEGLGKSVEECEKQLAD